MAFPLLFACTPEDNNGNGSEKTQDGGNNSSPSVTIGAEHISAISAVLAGKANLGSTVAADLQVGFQYSKSAGILPSNSKTVEATDADSDYNYTASITGLDPATKYYFRSFVRQNGQDTYGETKEFTTKDVASFLETKDASEVEAEKATLNAKLDLTNALYKSLAYGFLWGISEGALNTDIKCTDMNDKAISATLTDISYSTKYWYKAYVTLDSRTFYGEVKTFTTTEPIAPEEAVGLGIVMTRGDGTTYKLYWAQSNLSESGLCAKSEDYGDHYQWGMTTTTDDYSWGEYSLIEGGKMSKYNTVDQKTVLETGPNGDDAASKILGKKWRMPSAAEWTELITKCTWTWTTQNGVAGKIATGPNGNSIFIPAAGQWSGTYYRNYGNDGSGYYWSSSLSTDTEKSNSAMYVWITLYQNGEGVHPLLRYYGNSIRPVWEE